MFSRSISDKIISLMMTEHPSDEYKLEDLICEQFVPDQEHCTSIGENIANSFITVAGSKIFKEPDRAFIELPLNSIDSYRGLRGQPSVGKFGMGFYSIFIYLIGYPDHYIVMTSRTKTEAWTITFTYDHGIKIKYSQRSDLKHTGTYIRINFSEAHPNNTSKIQELIKNYLVYIPDVNITLNGAVVNGEFMNKGVTDVVTINVDDLYMTVSDRAAGIPTDILFTNLLIPGSSSKGIKATRLDPNFKSITGVYSNNNLNFSILVGDIPIYRNNKIPYGLVLQIPYNTPLPVSRDNILFTPEVKKVFMEQCELLFHNIIHKHLVILPDVMDTIKKFVNDTWFDLFINGYLTGLTKKGIFFLNAPHVICDYLSKLTGLKVAHVSEEASRSDHLKRLEDICLRQQTLDKVFLGKKVLLIDSDQVQLYTGNFNRLLILNRKLIDNIDNVILTNPEEQLQPWSRIRISEPEIENVLAKTDGLTYTFDLAYNEQSLQEHIRKLQHLDQFLADLYINKLLSYYRHITKKVQLLMSYGTVRPTLTMGNVIGILKVEKSDKIVDYLYTIILETFKIMQTNNINFIPCFWNSYYLPNAPRYQYILEKSKNIYSYLSVLQIARTFVESPSYYNIIDVMLNYYDQKIDSPNVRGQLLKAVITNTKAPHLNELMTIGHSVSDQIILKWTRVDTMSSNFSYSYRQLLERSFEPDFVIEEVLGLNQTPKVNGNIQLIQIASNVPFTNPFRDSVMALSSNVHNEIINANLYVTEQNHLVLSVKQCHNISLTQLLAASIPFSSTTGGLGISLFRIMPLVKWLQWEFSYNHQRYRFIDTPVVVNDQVVDVVRDIYTIHDDHEGTIVTCEFKDLFDVNMALLETGYLFNEVYSLVKPVVYQGNTIHPKPYERYDIGEATVSYIKDRKSWYFVDGYPVSELSVLLDQLYEVNHNYKGYQEMLTGILVDAKTNITDKDKLMDGIFQVMCHKYVDLNNGELQNTYLLNTTSPYYSQIRKFPRTINNIANSNYDFIGEYLPTFSLKSINNVINDLLDRYSDKYQGNDIPLAEIKKDLQEYNLPYICVIVIIKWFLYKIKSPNNDNDQNKVTTLSDAKINEINIWLQQFVDKYWQVVLSLNIKGINPKPYAPLIKLAPLTNVMGHYIPSVQLIEISDTRVESTNFDQDPDAIRRGINDTRNVIYGLRFPPSTLIHELFHALLGTEHSNHDDVTLTINNITCKYTFNQGANEIYKQVILNNFI